MSGAAEGAAGASAELPEAYVAEKAREAIAHEAHALGIEVTFLSGEFRLDGMVETAEQRARVESAARTVIGGRPLRNRLVIARPEAEVEPEELA